MLHIKMIKLLLIWSVLLIQKYLVLQRFKSMENNICLTVIILDTYIVYMIHRVVKMILHGHFYVLLIYDKPINPLLQKYLKRNSNNSINTMLILLFIKIKHIWWKVQQITIQFLITVIVRSLNLLMTLVVMYPHAEIVVIAITVGGV